MKTCKIKLKKNNGIPIVKIIGNLTFNSIVGLSKKMENLSKSQCETIVVDLSETDYIDSHGLGVFVYTWKMMEQNEKELIFLNPKGFIKSMFQGTNLHEIFKVVDSLEEL